MKPWKPRSTKVRKKKMYIYISLIFCPKMSTVLLNDSQEEEELEEELPACWSPTITPFTIFTMLSPSMRE